MDKNHLVGGALIFLIIVGYSIMTAPSPEEYKRQQFVKDSIAMVESNTTILENESAETDQITPAGTENLTKLSNSPTSIDSTNTSNASTIKEENFVLENNLLKVTFSNKGGNIKEVFLKEYKRIIDVDKKEQKVDLFMLNNPKNRFEYILPIAGGTVSTENMLFNGSKSGQELNFNVEIKEGQFIQNYSLKDDSYELDYTIQFINLDGVIEDRPVELNWVNYLNRIEKNVEFEKTVSTVYYKVPEENPDELSKRSDDDEEVITSIQWVSHVNQFFNTSLLSKDKLFEGGSFETKTLPDTSEPMKVVSSRIGIPYAKSTNESIDMIFYLGPNVFETLEGYNVLLEDIIPFGSSLFGTINRHVIRPAFNFLSRYIGSKGIVIIILILIIKIILYPLMYKMLHSQAKMSALKPEIAHLKDKYKDEPQKVQMETMAIYREYGVSPLGGCMPMLLQMPIWYALFRFFPAAITFRQEAFLWATDLSSYDSIFTLPFTIPMYGDHVSLFTLLWALSTVAYTHYNTKHMDMSANPAMMYVQYLMPLVFIVFFNNYASALTCYMLFSNLFNIAQTVLTKRYIFTDNRINAELRKDKAKPKKKGGFQAKLAEALKEQQNKQKGTKK